MSRKGIALWLTLVMLLSFLVIVVEVSQKVSAYTPHAPIAIDGDADFASQAASEGWQGNGTEGDPYVIKGYEITRAANPSSNRISIHSTTVHFVIKDSRIVGSSFSTNIVLRDVRNGIISNCTIENSSYGIYILAGDSNIISNNTLKNSDIYVSSYNCSFTGNTLIEGGFEIWGLFVDRWTSNNIDVSNTINGKPVYYLKNQNEGSVPPGAGQVILANCTNIIVENQELTNSSNGILLGYSSNNYIQNNTVRSNYKEGIDVWHSHGNIIMGNNVSSNLHGFWIQSSNNNTIQFNEVRSNSHGIFISNSNGNYVFGNNVSSNARGIEIRSSGQEPFKFGKNIISNNTLMDNWGYGISLDNAHENTISNNIAMGNSDAGFYLTSSVGNNINGNIAINNPYGLHLDFYSNENSIISNNLSNNYNGIKLQFSNENIFHHNSIINNTFQLNKTDSSENYWDDGNGRGNYWSDYEGIDIDGDGVGDTRLPHQDVDYYPLTEDRGASELIRWTVIILIIFFIIVILLIALMSRRKRRAEEDDLEKDSGENPSSAAETEENEEDAKNE